MRILLQSYQRPQQVQQTQEQFFYFQSLRTCQQTSLQQQMVKYKVCQLAFQSIIQVRDKLLIFHTLDFVFIQLTLYIHRHMKILIFAIGPSLELVQLFLKPSKGINLFYFLPFFLYLPSFRWILLFFKFNFVSMLLAQNQRLFHLMYCLVMVFFGRLCFSYDWLFGCSFKMLKVSYNLK